MKRIEHIDVPAGAAVFWDQRIPHANAYKNEGNEAREVVYGGFLPRGIDINDRYAEEQRRRFITGRPQTDFWSNGQERKHIVTDLDGSTFDALSASAKKLLQ